MSSTGFTDISVPARIANIAFKVSIPPDWRRVDLPEEELNFDKPDYFVPLFVAMAGYGVVVFSVAARPAYEDGTVEQWVRYIGRAQEVQIQQLRPVSINGCGAMIADAFQQSDAGLMQMRTVFLEDGGRLINISTMAPAQIWSSVEAQLDQMLHSFRLDEPRGATAQLQAETDQPATPSPEPAKAADIVATALEGIVTEDPRLVANDPDNPTPVETAQEPTKPADVALADDDASLDPENAMNARLRDNGVGLVPRMIHVDRNFKYAVLAAGAIESTFKLPLGWHCIDDGRRTLVFDAAGRIQVNLNLRPAEGRSHEQVLDQILEQYQAEHPTLEHLRLEAAGIKMLCMRNMVINGEALEQAFLIRESHRHDMVLVCRATAKTEDMPRAMNLSEVILLSLQPPLEDSSPQRPAAASAPPAWWQQALALEQAGRVDDGAKHILDTVRDQGALISTAELYKLHMMRMKKDGNTPAAAAAYRKSRDYAYSYAASATSGGEGTALSMQRDDFLAELAEAWGHLPPE